MQKSLLWLLFVYVLSPVAVRCELQKIIRIAAPIPISGYNDTTFQEGIQRLHAFVFFVDFLNRKLKPLNVTIKYAIGDSGTTLSENSLDFTSGVSIGLILSKKNLIKGKGIHGLVGPGTNILTKALSKIMFDSDIAQISYCSDASSLSHLIDYPTHSRVYPTTSNQAVAIVETIYNSFSWRRVVVIYTGDHDGQDSFSAFRFRASQLGIEIIASFVVTAGATCLDIVLQLKASKSDPRIFVLLLFNVSMAQKIIYNAIKHDVLNKDSFLIGNAAISNEKLWKGMPDINNDNYMGLKEIMAGYIGVLEPTFDWMVAPMGKKFLEYYHKQPPTM